MFDSENYNSSEVQGVKSRTINFKTEVKSPIEKLKAASYVLKASNAEELSKKQKFEAFLSYRKYLSRLALAQGLQFYETFKIINPEKLTIEEEINEIYRVIIYFYKKIFFPNKYGENKKNKKLEERFVRYSIGNYLKNKETVDTYIKNNISKKWHINRLNSVIRSVLRAAICEVLFAKKLSHKIIISEYTDIIAMSVSTKKEIDFFNAVLDSILKQINKDYA